MFNLHRLTALGEQALQHGLDAAREHDVHAATYGCRLISETRTLKGRYFQLVETKCFQPRVNLMSTCTAATARHNNPIATV